MTQDWAASRLWPGETVVCLGGGPSLTAHQVAAARWQARIIAINDSYRLAPWADVLYACDARWWDWHDGAPSFAGLKVSQDAKLSETHPDVRLLAPTGIDGFDPHPGNIRTGKNGGYQAIHLAAHMGAAKIVLLGYDMQPTGGRTHWHEGHPVRTRPEVYGETMLPRFATLAAPLAKLGVRVVNATPGSALDAFPRTSLARALK